MLSLVAVIILAGILSSCGQLPDGNSASQKKVAIPTFSVAGGVYTSPQSVTISTETVGAAIFYTIDNSTPTSSSSPYTGAISISATTTLKAIAVKEGMTGSDVATAFYILSLPPAPSTTITITDHPDALTASGTDNLFILTLTKAPKSYVLSDLMVDANLPGQQAYAVNWDHNDTNGNGLLDVGESLTCKEPGVNLFDTTTVGKTVNVSLDEKLTTTSYQVVASGTWTPAN
jgi:hypothetical protein